MNPSTNYKHAGLIRRLFVISYDAFLLIALLFLTTALFTSLNHGEAIKTDELIYIPFVLCLTSITFLYYAWFWVHGGQTLGLKTWRCQVRQPDGRPLTWKQASIRFFTAILSFACLGIGFLWSIFHPEKLTWHDILSKTVTIDCREH